MKRTMPSNINEKYNHNKTDTPIPLALSLVFTAASIAIATKITDNNKPTTNMINPVAVNSNSKIGMPTPMKNANESEHPSPKKILSQMVFHFKGWLTSSSKNS